MTNSPFSDEVMKERLFDRRNVEALEFILEREGRRLRDYDVPTENERWIYSINEIREKIFPEVKDSVEKFLEVKSQPSVEIEPLGILSTILTLIFTHGYGAYHSGKRIIKINNFNKKEIMKAVLTHEYVHHVQTSEGVPYSFLGFSILREGHAEGIENKITNEPFLLLKKRNQYLEVAYHLICMATRSKQKIQLSSTLGKNIMEGRILSFLERKSLFDLSYYELGTAFFSLSELKHGQSVYARALRRDEGILELH